MRKQKQHSNLSKRNEYEELLTVTGDWSNDRLAKKKLKEL